MIPVKDRNYDVNDAGTANNDAMTANIRVVIPVIDRNYDINGVVTANLAKSQEI